MFQRVSDVHSKPQHCVWRHCWRVLLCHHQRLRVDRLQDLQQCNHATQLRRIRALGRPPRRYRARLAQRLV